MAVTTASKAPKWRLRCASSSRGSISGAVNLGRRLIWSQGDAERQVVDRSKLPSPSLEKIVDVPAAMWPRFKNKSIFSPPISLTGVGDAILRAYAILTGNSAGYARANVGTYARPQEPRHLYLRAGARNR